MWNLCKRVSYINILALHFSISDYFNRISKMNFVGCLYLWKRDAIWIIHFYLCCTVYDSVKYSLFNNWSYWKLGITDLFIIEIIISDQFISFLREWVGCVIVGSFMHFWVLVWNDFLGTFLTVSFLGPTEIKFLAFLDIEVQLICPRDTVLMQFNVII